MRGDSGRKFGQKEPVKEGVCSQGSSREELSEKEHLRLC